MNDMDVLDSLVESVVGEPNFAAYCETAGPAEPHQDAQLCRAACVPLPYDLPDPRPPVSEIVLDVREALARLPKDLQGIAEKIMTDKTLTREEAARIHELRAAFRTAGVVPETRYPRSEPSEEYHAQAKRYLSSHQLGDFRKCPLLHHRKQIGLIPDADTDAYLVGRAAHTLILEGQDRFNAEYAIGGPINPKTGKPFGPQTKAFAEWAEAQGKSVLTEAQHQLVVNLARPVGDHEEARKLLAEGDPEQVARATYCDVPSQTRTDWLHPNRGLVDLKTCDDLAWFESDARRYGYAHQLAFYRAVLGLVLGTTLPVWMIAVEKKEPYRCGVWKVDPEVLGQAQRENEAAIERLKQCRRRNAWPTGYEEVRVFDYV